MKRTVFVDCKAGSYRFTGLFRTYQNIFSVVVKNLFLFIKKRLAFNILKIFSFENKVINHFLLTK